MVVVNNLYIASKQYPRFRGDKEILKSLSTFGIEGHNYLASDDIFVTRPDKSEKEYVQKILASSGSNNFLIAGDATVGKSTFMLRVAHLLEKEEGIKTFVLSNVCLLNNPVFLELKKHLTENPNIPTVIFMDEIWTSLDVLEELEKLSKNNPNIKIVATALNDERITTPDCLNSFPIKNRVILRKIDTLFVPMINSALKAAGFSEMPENIGKLINKNLKQLPDHRTYSIRNVFGSLHRFLSENWNREDDRHTIETIPDNVWYKVADHISYDNSRPL